MNIESIPYGGNTIEFTYFSDADSSVYSNGKQIFIREHLFTTLGLRILEKTVSELL